VSAHDGSIFPGLNISLKGTNHGTTTDSQGEYSITAESGTISVFSFIGFQTTGVPVGSQTREPNLINAISSKVARLDN
jgi:hypothetical protein